MGLGIPPLKFKIMLESNPLKSTMLAGRVAVVMLIWTHSYVYVYGHVCNMYTYCFVVYSQSGELRELGLLYYSAHFSRKFCGSLLRRLSLSLSLSLSLPLSLYVCIYLSIYLSFFLSISLISHCKMTK